MIHNFKYAFKILSKNKMLLFWTFAFPIILGTFFSMAFSNIETNEKLSIIPIAMVDTETLKENKIVGEAFKILGDETNENQLFKIEYTNEEKAKDLLEKEEIDGYILLEEKTKVIVRASGINETILKYVTEEILSNQKLGEQIAKKKMEEMPLSSVGENFYQNLYAEITKMLENGQENVKDISSSNLSYTMIEYYTLIAMTCLYGGILGMVAVNQNLANMSSAGKRISISPMKKGHLLFTSILASFLTQLIGVALLFFYTIFVLHVDYGNNIPLIILLAIVGSLAGLSLGVVLAASLKANENTKTGIVISITMAGCFLAGMMGITMKYIIDKNLPFLNKINPANLITDGFYSLYYYNTLDRYLGNIIGLLIFSFILFGIAGYHLRRQQYDSI